MSSNSCSGIFNRRNGSPPSAHNGKLIITCDRHGIRPVLEVCPDCTVAVAQHASDLETALSTASNIMTELFTEGRSYLRVLKLIAGQDCPHECDLAMSKASDHTTDCPVGLAQAVLDGCEVRMLSKKAAKT